MWCGVPTFLGVMCHTMCGGVMSLIFLVLCDVINFLGVVWWCDVPNFPGVLWWCGVPNFLGAVWWCDVPNCHTSWLTGSTGHCVHRLVTLLFQQHQWMNANYKEGEKKPSQQKSWTSQTRSTLNIDNIILCCNKTILFGESQKLTKVPWVSESLAQKLRKTSCAVLRRLSCEAPGRGEDGEFSGQRQSRRKGLGGSEWVRRPGH